MARYIDADKLKKLRDDVISGKINIENEGDLIDACPTADVVEVKHGYWKFNSDGSGTCSECHFTQRGVWDYDNHQHYCGVCGAIMDGGNE